MRVWILKMNTLETVVRDVELGSMLVGLRILAVQFSAKEQDELKTMDPKFAAACLRHLKNAAPPWVDLKLPKITESA